MNSEPKTVAANGTIVAGGAAATGRAVAEGTALLPDLLRDGDAPVFRAPWEAQAFAMAVALHQRGLFTWSQWARVLAEQIATAQASGDADLGDTYYRHWVGALEKLVSRL
jgi:nitrile hydratase accessory protein